MLWWSVAVQRLSRVWLFATPWTTAHQASLSITSSQGLLRLMSIKSVMPPNHLISVVPFCFCLQPLPASGSFLRNQFFTSGGQSIRASASASVLSFNEYSRLISFRMEMLSFKPTFSLSSFTFIKCQIMVWSPCRPKDSQESSPTPQFKSIKSWRSALFIVQLSHPYMTTGKNIALTWWTFVGKAMSLLLNMLCRLVIAFLPRSMCLLILWLPSPSAVILEPKEIKCHCFHFFPTYLPWSDGTGCHDLSFVNVVPAYSLSPFTSSRGSLVPLHFLPLEWYHLHIWGYWYFSQQSWFQLVLHPAWHFAWCTLHMKNWKEGESRSIVSNYLWPHEILQVRILEWVAFPFSRESSQPRIEPRSPTLQADSLPAKPQGKPKNTGVGSLSLLQRIFPTQDSNWGLLVCRWILYQLS